MNRAWPEDRALGEARRPEGFPQHGDAGGRVAGMFAGEAVPEGQPALWIGVQASVALGQQRHDGHALRREPVADDLEHRRAGGFGGGAHERLQRAPIVEPVGRAAG